MADSAAGGKCGTLGVSDVSFGIAREQCSAAGTCGAASSGVFAYSAGSWRQVSLPVSGRVVRMLPGLALVASGSRLYAAWDTASRLVGLRTAGRGRRRGLGPLRGGRGMGAAAGRAARRPSPGRGSPGGSLPAVPAGTAVLAAGPGGAVDALAVSREHAAVWRLAGAATAWSKIQTIDVPIQFGSSS